MKSMRQAEPIVKKEKGFVTVKCPYCGAEYKVPSTVTYATCPYCGTTFRIDKPGEKIEHYLYRLIVDKNKAYRLARDFATQQIGVVEDLVERSSFKKAKLYYVPIYIYEVNVKTPCREEEEELEKEEEEIEKGETSEIKLKIHGGEEVEYILRPAVDKIPLPMPENYGFPARSRMYFKPSVLKDGLYLQPVLDPLKIFAEVKEPRIKKAINEARISCSGGYDVVDESKYLGIAHYPFWHIVYTYDEKEYNAIVDASDGSIVYLEYPLSFKGRLRVFGAGSGVLLLAAGLGALVTYNAMGDPFTGFVGGLVAALPGFFYGLSRIARFKGKYWFKPGEQAIFVPPR